MKGSLVRFGETYTEKVAPGMYVLRGQQYKLQFIKKDFCKICGEDFINGMCPKHNYEFKIRERYEY